MLCSTNGLFTEHEVPVFFFFFHVLPPSKAAMSSGPLSSASAEAEIPVKYDSDFWDGQTKKVNAANPKSRRYCSLFRVIISVDWASSRSAVMQPYQLSAPRKSLSSSSTSLRLQGSQFTNALKCLRIW